jgi:hypothetical protein
MRVKLLQRAEAFDEHTKKVHPTKNAHLSDEPKKEVA